MDPVIYIQLAKAPIQPLLGFENHTALLSSPHKFKTHVVLCFCDPDIQKGADVSGVFNAVRPLDRKWILEIAVELPDLLPSIDGKSEAILNTRDKRGKLCELCLSNRVSRFHYDDDNTPYHVLVPRKEEWHGSLQIQGSGGATITAAEEQLRTVASMRFVIEGDNTENAFETSIKSCLQKLFDCINMALDATRDSGVNSTPITRSATSDGASVAYVLVSGDGDPQGTKLVLSGSRVFLYPVEIHGEQASRFRAVADGSVPFRDVDRLVGASRSSWQDGDYEFAFLQAVIAAEIATTRAVTAECLRRGVSKNKLTRSTPDRLALESYP